MRKAIVMAGGHGTRLRPLTLTRPKPLMPVANRPVLAHLLEWLRRHGFREVLVTLHYRADDIRRAFGDGRALGLKITYQVEETPLGTAGSVKFAEGWIRNEPFLVASGDALTDLDLAALKRQHRRTGAWLTLGLKQVDDPSQYGVAELDERGRIARFQEKPGAGRAFSHLANTGIYVVEPRVLRHIPTGRPYDWSRDVFPQLLAEELPLFGCELRGYWCDIGSLSAYRQSQWDALAGALRVGLAATELRPGVWVGQNVRIVPSAVLEAPVLIGSGCRIERDVKLLAGSILGDETTVRPRAYLRNATLGARCEVGARAILQDCVIDEQTQIAPDCSVSDAAVIGRNCRLTAAVQIGGEQRLQPFQVISGNPRPPGPPAYNPANPHPTRPHTRRERPAPDRGASPARG